MTVSEGKPTLYILGAGGHGKVAAECAEDTKRYTKVAFLDDAFAERKAHEHWSIVGKMEDADRLVQPGDQVFVAIGNNAARKTYCQKLLASGLELAVLVHPTAIVSRYSSLSAGTLVCAGAIVNGFTQIGVGAIINTGSKVDHDCHIGDYVHIAPGVSMAGSIQIGHGSFIGIGSTIIQGMTVGAECMLGAGSTLLTALPDKVVAVGSPARIIKSKLK